MPKGLVSGPSIRGHAVAYWLARGGFEVTVVEPAPALRVMREMRFLDHALPCPRL